MTNGTQVAVKMLSLRSLNSPCQGSKEFQNEVHLLMRVHHRSLVPFIGYCQEDGNMALIYEYIAQGQLGSRLSGKPAIVRISASKRRSLIDWAIPIVVGGDAKDVIDPNLEGNHDIKSIQKVAEIARLCTSPKSVDRPHMRDVVVELKEYIGNEKALESGLESGGCIDSGPVQTSSEILSYLSAR